MYLRTRYKKLQKKIVSRMPSSRQATSRQTGSGKGTDSSEIQDPQVVPPPGGLDSSFQAIRALNGQPGLGSVPEVIQAIVMDRNGNLQRLTDCFESTTATIINDDDQSRVPSRNEPRSFGARVNRLMQAVDRQQRIRFARSGNGQDVDVFASPANGSETGSPRSVTDQIAAHPENWGRIMVASDIAQLQSQKSSDDVGESSCLEACHGIHIS
ncbi:MAG: hypothetical protein Q9224_005541, partial [Gallowayella concinna]